MAKDVYKGSIGLIDGLKPLGNFPIAAAADIWIPERWDKRVNVTEPEDRGSARVDIRIQELEDDKVNRNGDTLVGDYTIKTGNLHVAVDVDTGVGGIIYCSHLYGTGSIIIEDYFSIRTEKCEINVPLQVFKNTIIGTSENKANLTVYGDLTVIGNSYIEHQRQLEIDDNLLVLNRSIDGTVYGAENAGLVFCSTIGTYGIILDVQSSVMRLGLGTLIGDNTDPTKDDYEFQFKTGQGLPFALRNEEKTEAQENVAWSSSDTSEASKRMGSLEIPVWDKEKHCFISSNYTISELTDDIKGKIKDNNTGTGKYSTLLELENALVNDDDYTAGENKYNIPQLKKYVEDNFYSQAQANDKFITREEINENSTLYNNPYSGVFNKEYVIVPELTESFYIRLFDNDERPYNSFVFKTGSISNFNFSISVPGSDATIKWSTIKPQYISDCYYHIEIIKAGNDTWLASWTMYQGDSEVLS